MPSTSVGSAADSGVSGILESLVPADQQASTSPIHSAATPFYQPPFSTTLHCCDHHPRPSFLNVCLRDARCHGEARCSQCPLISLLYKNWTRWVWVNIALDPRSPRLLRGRSFSRSSCIVSTSRECLMSVIVVFKQHLLLINRASFKFLLLSPVITLVSQTFWNFCLSMFSQAG